MPDSSAPPLANREIVSTRHFPHSREKLFAAFSNPANVAQWWGPKGFTNKIQEFDLRPGGLWRLTMIAPTGAEYHNVSRFLEVVPAERVSFVHEEPVHRFTMTMTFAPHGAGTTLTWRMAFDSADEVAKVGQFIVAANEENFDRLGAHLAGTTSN